MCFWNTVKSTHVALGLVPKILDPVDVVSTLCKELGMVYAIVFEFGDIKRIIAPPTVRINDAIWDNFAFDDWRQSCTRGIGNDFGVNLSTPFK